jgi:hypothetical protein
MRDCHCVVRDIPAQYREEQRFPTRVTIPRDTTRTARIEARLAPDVLALLKRAAEIEGRSVSEFVVSAAQEAARRAIEDAEIIRLSLAGQRAPSPVTAASSAR